MATILTIDDDALVRRVCAAALGSAGHAVITYAPVAGETLSACARLLDHHDVDLVLCDYQFPGMNGLELYRQLAASQLLDGIEYAFMTGAPTAELLAAGPPVLHKPFGFDELCSFIDAYLYPRLRASSWAS